MANVKPMTKFKRRHLLKGAGYSAMVGLMPQLAQAENTDQTIRLVTVGTKIKEGLQDGCHIPLPDHVVSEDSLVLFEPNDTVLNRITENKVLAYNFNDDSKYAELPTTLLENHSRKDIATTLNNSLLPSNLISARHSVPYPTIRIQQNDREVIVRSENQRIVLAPGTQKVIEKEPIDIVLPPNSRGEDNVKSKVTPIIVTRYSGELEVKLLKDE